MAERKKTNALGVRQPANTKKISDVSLLSDVAVPAYIPSLATIKKTTSKATTASYLPRVTENKIFILKSKDERKKILSEREERERLRRIKNMQPTDTKVFESLRTISREHKELFNRIYNAFDLEEETVRNIIAYVRCLPKPGTDQVDHTVFYAQMKTHFNLTDTLILERMVDVCNFENVMNCTGIRMEDFIELICIFMSEDKDIKVRFVFAVYNIRNNGFLSRRDFEYFIRPMVSEVNRDVMDDDPTDNTTLNDFVNMLMNAIDRNNDDLIDLDEFRYLVHRNVLMMTCLGPCLPEEAERLKFLKKLEGKSTLEIGGLYRNERQNLLRSTRTVVGKDHGYQRFYPVHLEPP